MKAPEQILCPDIEAAHVTRWHFARERNIIHFRTHDDYVAAEYGRGRNAIQLPIDRSAKSLRQIDLTIVAEA
jgi:hypothetical protein